MKDACLLVIHLINLLVRLLRPGLSPTNRGFRTEDRRTQKAGPAPESNDLLRWQAPNLLSRRTARLCKGKAPYASDCSYHQRPYHSQC